MNVPLTEARIIALLAGYPAKVYSLVMPLAEEELRWRPQEGEWSLKEVVCHLRDSAERLGERLQRVATEDNPFLPAFDENALVHELNYQEALLPVVLMRYSEHRQVTLDLLRSLSATAWVRQGTHQERGPQTFREIAETMTNHEVDHLEQMRKLRREALAASR